MDFAKNEVRYEEDGKMAIIPFGTFANRWKSKVAPVRLARRSRFARITVTPIEISVAAADGKKGIFVPVKSHGSVLLATTATEARNGNAWVPVVNAGGGRVKGELVSGSVLGDDETPLEDEQDVNIGTEEEGERALAIRFIRACQAVTGNMGVCLPAITLDVRHHIDTGDAAPLMLKRRRQAQTEDAVTDQNVDAMLNAGVIEEDNGAWGFLVVLVRKKDGEVRFRMDYRALNKITKKDAYPLLRIDETLEVLRGALLFTTLDVREGYWQIRVAKGDRDKTAFTTKRGLGGIERHVIELASVLDRLAISGLTLKLKKCVFATTSMEYLGHELRCNGVRPVERLVTAVKEFPRPAYPVAVKRFVHLVGYYRKFVEAFGSIMAPLTKLLRKGVEWQWTPEQEFAFERVKMILTTKPLLIYPNFELPFRLVTDASKVRLGADATNTASDASGKAACRYRIRPDGRRAGSNRVRSNTDGGGSAGSGGSASGVRTKSDGSASTTRTANASNWEWGRHERPQASYMMYQRREKWRYRLCKSLTTRSSSAVQESISEEVGVGGQQPWDESREDLRPHTHQHEKWAQSGVAAGVVGHDLQGVPRLCVSGASQGTTYVRPHREAVLVTGYAERGAMVVAGCQKCGSRKARPKEVMLPLRSIGGGDVGDRWALDVIGPFPMTDGGQRYVVAAHEYVTHYAVATKVTQHTGDFSVKRGGVKVRAVSRIINGRSAGTDRQGHRSVGEHVAGKTNQPGPLSTADDRPCGAIP
ncbi:unnamed protein product [Phytophthora fragariaefolia]|uniref:Unnamed protein product n=1 Tax=Phytophthora fragariaefolia TaxID=1490495 RepID=A0A9W7D3X9_9STRA|nr:unnamed protein product [Phytophthora fragariaefolia]